MVEDFSKETFNENFKSEHKRDYHCRSGIPDPWEEYLIFKEVGNKGYDLWLECPKRDLNIAETLARNNSVNTGQGIPDPNQMRIKMQDTEPPKNLRQLKDEIKLYIKSLRSGTSLDLITNDQVQCPHCDKQLTILCERNRQPNKTGDEKDTQPEKLLKDACVETDEVPKEVKRVKIPEDENDICKSCPVCNPVHCDMKYCKKRSHNKDNARFDNRGSHCKKDCHNTECFNNILPHVLRTLQGHNNNGPLTKMVPINGPTSILPFYYSHGNCPCSSQQVIGFEEKPEHCVEMKLVCPTCEKFKKQRRREKRCDKQVDDKNEKSCHWEGKVHREQKAHKRNHNQRFTCDLSKIADFLSKSTGENIDDEKVINQNDRSRKDYTDLLTLLGVTDHISPGANEISRDKRTVSNCSATYCARACLNHWKKNAPFEKTYHLTHWKTNFENDCLYDSEEEWMDHMYKRHDILMRGLPRCRSSYSGFCNIRQASNARHSPQELRQIESQFRKRVKPTKKCTNKETHSESVKVLTNESDSKSDVTITL